MFVCEMVTAVGQDALPVVVSSCTFFDEEGICLQKNLSISLTIWLLYRYIMFGRGISEKYQSRDETFPGPNGEGNLVSRLVFFAGTPPKHDISV